VLTIATDAVAWSVCLLVSFVSSANTGVNHGGQGGRVSPEFGVGGR